MSTPPSLASDSEVARVGKVAKKVPIATATGVANCITRTPDTASTVSFPATMPMTTSHTMGIANVKMRTILVRQRALTA
nr:hypothetical protein [Cryobacterium sp. Sr8]